MSDELNNNISGEEDVNAEPQTNNEPVNETKTEAPHTSVPGGDGYVYTQNGGAYRGTDGQYGTYNAQNNQSGAYYGTNQNGYGYYQQQNGYNYQYAQRTQQPQYQPPVQQKKKSGGKTAAIIIVAAVLCVIFTLTAFVAGLVIARRFTRTPVPSDPSVESRQVESSSDKTEPDVTTSEPKTNPNAHVSTDSSGETLSRTDAAAKVVDSVVEIRTESVQQGSFMQQYVVQGAGSGVIITSDGYIATNHHVIDGATQITVTLRSGKTYNASLVGSDADADLAVVKIEETGLQPATFGDSSKLVVAQSVICVGNPLGQLGGSVMEGIISSLERTIMMEDQEMTLMQTTAAINPGASGGGLFNLSGECIGIVDGKSYGTGIEGIGFVIASNTAVPVLDDLMKYGYVRGKVMLGVSFVEITDNYSMHRYGVSEFGVYVAKIGSGSDAETAGLKVGDRIVTFNGKEVDSYATIKSLIRKCKAGESVPMTVSRDGSTIDLTVTFTEYVPSTVS